MGETTVGRKGRTPVSGDQRPFVPASGRGWLLPLYDPLTRLLGVARVHRRLIDQAGLRPGQRGFWRSAAVPATCCWRRNRPSRARPPWAWTPT